MRYSNRFPPEIEETEEEEGGHPPTGTPGCKPAYMILTTLRLPALSSSGFLDLVNGTGAEIFQWPEILLRGKEAVSVRRSK